MSEAPQTEPAQETFTPTPFWRKVFRLVRKTVIWGVLGFTGLLFLIYFLLLLPPVQHFAVGRITGLLESELKTEVNLEGIQLQLFDRFSLTGLEIMDRKGEPLLKSGRTEVNFQALLLNLVRKRMVIQDITLQHARINWVHPYGATEPNIQFLFDYLKKDKPQEDSLPKNGIDLRIKTFFLEDVQLVKLDSVRGNRLTISIREGDGLVNLLDLKNNSIDAKHLFFDGLQIGVDVFEADSTTLAVLFPPLTDEQLNDPLQNLPGLAGFPNLCVDVFHIRDGKFFLNNYRKEPARLTPPDILNFNYLDVFKIDIVIRSLSFADQQFHGIVDLISFENSTGFRLEKLTAKDVTVSDKTVELYGMRLITPKSSLGDTLIFSYKTYTDYTIFPDAVRMDLRLRESSLWINDLLTFVPGLERNLFFQKNREEVLDIDGHVSGKVNSLRGRDLQIRLARNTLIMGDFSSLFLGVPDLASLNLRLKRLETNVNTLRELIPGFNLPANFDKLGRLVFSGSFDGFFSDFVAYGDLRTQIGRATVDMKLSKGHELPQYSGKLALLNFDLKEFTGNSQFGNVTFTSQVLDGKGLTEATANARLEASIDSISFRNYMYKNLVMEGQLNRNLFDGSFGIQDQNIDFNFLGTIDFTRSVPFFDFAANVRRVDLKQLNLSEQDLVFSGLVDLKIQDVDLAKASGEIALKNFLLLRDHKKAYTIDTLSVKAEGAGDQKSLILRSELVNGKMEGRFNLKEISKVFFEFLDRNYTTFASRMGIPKTELAPADTSHFQFELSVDDTKDWMELLIPKLGPLGNGKVQGYFSNRNDSLWLEVDLPSVKLGDMVFENVYLNADALRDTCVMDFGIFRTILASQRELAPISLLGLVNRDTLNFGITAVDYDQLLNKLEMDGVFFLDDQDFSIRFAESKMVILNNEWHIQKNNSIRFGKDFIQTREFVLTSEKRHIILQSLDRRGLQLSLRQFDLDDLNSLLEYEPIQFSGGIDLEASIDDLFNLGGLHLVAQADSLMLNAVDYGALRIDVEAENLRSPFTGNATVTKGNQKIKASGFYNPPNFQRDPSVRTHPATQNYMDAKVEMTNFPLSFLDIWIGDAVSDTEGLVTGNAKISGEPAKPDLSGKASVRNGAVTIDFLNTRYFIDKQSVELTNTLIDATGAILTDQLGNRAIVYGGITHDRMKHMGLNAQIRSDNFLMLNTKKGQNEMFYGTAIGSGNLLFTGPFEKPDIYVNATSKSGTHIILPISSSRSASEVKFIHFTKRYRKPDSDDLVPNAQEELGLAVEMDLNITDDAIIEMVFDEQAGDILRGRGNGTIQMVVPRNGDFLMYGDYVVSSGDYLFTLMNLVNKPFVVRRGGNIRWSGDPFKALINIDAEYKDLKASLSNFLDEYLASETEPRVRELARLPEDVDLVMNLSGELLSPTVSFDIQFPRVPNELKNYTDSKLRILRQDQNEMNRQVFGLVILGQFLPTQIAAIQGQELAIGINTLTEMLSQQLSNYVTGLVSEWLTEDGLISSIDFDIAYNYVQGTDATNSEYYRSNEVQIRLKNYLFNNRLAVNVGGNFDLTAKSVYQTSGSWFAGDLGVEYYLTKDQTLKIRFYQSTEPAIEGGRRQNKTGLGLSYRKEFDTFDEFLKGLKGTAKRMGGS